MNKARLIGKYCEYCGQELNTWDDRVRKALDFDFDICENCIAEEYNINIERLKAKYKAEEEAKKRSEGSI